jgi:hypothetical protein
MEILKRIEELESKMKKLIGGSSAPVSEAEARPEMDDAEGEDEAPLEIDQKLSPEILERVYEGVLTILGELELEGQIPALDTPAKTRQALLAVVRQMYIKKSMISKMGRKFARFGAKRFLRKQRVALGKAVNQG